MKPDNKLVGFKANVERILSVCGAYVNRLYIGI